MIRKLLLAACGASLLFAAALVANHHHYQTAMKGVAAIMKPTNVALESADMATVQKNAATLVREYTVMAAWWEGRGSEAATKIADEGIQAATAMGKAASAGDAAGAKAAMATLSGTCKGCHSSHRTKNDDGSFGFKN